MKMKTLLILFVFLLVLNGCDLLFFDTITLEENERAVYIDQNGQAILLLPGEDSVSSDFRHVIYSDEMWTYMTTNSPIEGERIYSEIPFEFSIGDEITVFVELTLIYHYDLDQVFNLHKKWVMGSSENNIGSYLIRPYTLDRTRSVIIDSCNEDYVLCDIDEIENGILNELSSVLLQEGIIVDSFRVNSLTEK